MTSFMWGPEDAAKEPAPVMRERLVEQKVTLVSANLFLMRTSVAELRVGSPALLSSVSAYMGPTRRGLRRTERVCVSEGVSFDTGLFSRVCMEQT